MDHSTLEFLYDQHAEPLFRYLCSMIGHETEARDRLQDLFLKIARNPQCLDDVRDTQSYLFRLAHNIAIDAIRRRSTHREKLAVLAAEPIAIFAPATDPDAQILRDTMAHALTDLPIDQRETVYLKLYEDMTFEKIAGLLEISANTVASRYRYGIEKLRRTLKPLYDDINEDA